MIGTEWADFISTLKSIDVDPVEFFQEISEYAARLNNEECAERLIIGLASYLDGREYAGVVSGAFSWAFSAKGAVYWGDVFVKLQGLSYD